VKPATARRDSDHTAQPWPSAILGDWQCPEVTYVTLPPGSAAGYVSEGLSDFVVSATP
jgi:hypothetical protein